MPAIYFPSLFNISCSMCVYRILSESVFFIMFHVCLPYIFLVYCISCSMSIYHILAVSAYYIMFQICMPAISFPGLFPMSCSCVCLSYPFRVCLLYHVPCLPTISFPSLFSVYNIMFHVRLEYPVRVVYFIMYAYHIFV
jgi:hypothetical protein